jgi:hypothetical protein
MVSRLDMVEEHEWIEPRSPEPEPPRRDPRAAALTALQVGAGNAAVARLLAAHRPMLQRATVERLDVATFQDLHDNGFFPCAAAVGGGTATERTVAQALLARDLDFVSGDAWEAEVRMRARLIDAMTFFANSQSYQYNWKSDDLRLPPPWDGIPARTVQAFLPRANQSPLGAVRTLFNPPPNETFYLDCSSAIAASQYSAMAEAMDALGADFDAQYPREKVIVNAEGMETIQLPNGPKVAPPVEALYDEVTISSLNDLLPGDCVYFKSFSDYDQTHEGAEAAWAGEHAVYIGNDRFLGFGVAPQTHDQMVAQLVTSYNNQALKKSAAKRSASALENSNKSLSGKLPGLEKTVRRLRNFAG